MPPLVKVCVLGSTGVGKTKLIHQFVYNYYDDQYEPTMPKGNIVHCSTMINGNLYQVKIVDMPAIKEFPSDTSTEWSEYQQCLLRNAHAYIFVFDLNTPVTFHYVKMLRDQLFDSRNMQNVPVWIVGNKADLCLNVLATMRTHHRHDHHHHHHSGTSPRSLLLHASSIAQHQIVSPYEDLTPACKDFSNLVRKHWKCNYIECSAKYNWRIVAIFRELLKSIDPVIMTQQTELSSSSSVPGGGPGGIIQTSQQQQASTTKQQADQPLYSSMRQVNLPGASISINDTSITTTLPSRGFSPGSAGGEPPTTGVSAGANHSNRICHIL